MSLVKDKVTGELVCEKHGEVGEDTAWVNCHACFGEGGEDACEDDPINYSPGEEWDTCTECRGRGGWVVCGQCNLDNPDAEF